MIASPTITSRPIHMHDQVNNRVAEIMQHRFGASAIEGLVLPLLGVTLIPTMLLSMLF